MSCLQGSSFAGSLQIRANQKILPLCRSSTFPAHQGPGAGNTVCPRATQNLLHPLGLEWYVPRNPPSSFPVMMCSAQKTIWTGCWMINLFHYLQMPVFLTVTFCHSFFPSFPTALYTSMSSYDLFLYFDKYCYFKKEEKIIVEFKASQH